MVSSTLTTFAGKAWLGALPYAALFTLAELLGSGPEGRLVAFFLSLWCGFAVVMFVFRVATEGLRRTLGPRFVAAASSVVGVLAVAAVGVAGAGLIIGGGLEAASRESDWAWLIVPLGVTVVACVAAIGFLSWRGRLVRR